MSSPETAVADGVKLRPMTEADLGAAHALTQRLQWPHREDDWRFALRFGRGVSAERDGAVVGVALGFPWSARQATLGLVLVQPELQGKRIGTRLMQAVLELLGPRAVLLHATAEGRGLYERLGFVDRGEIRQHQGQAQPAPLPALADGERLRPQGRNDVDALIALDEQACALPRKALLRALLDEGDTVVLDRHGRAEGFAVARRFGRGQVIGPVVAPTLSGAQALIGHHLSAKAGRFVRIDVDAGGGLPAWLEDLGLVRVDSVRAMVRGTMRAPAGRWALVSQALG